MTDRETSDRLRHDIDSGRAGDKVSFSDPAAAPLGTDDEAAGTPPTAEQIRRARAAETVRPNDPSHGRPDRQVGSLIAGVPGTWLVAALVALAVLVALAAVWSGG